ncbi:MAG: hypothetical protein AAGA03_03835 [Planctomycetota bacterium]
MSHKPAAVRPPQVSLRFMMLMMVVFAVISAGFFYASMVPAVRDDLNALVGSNEAIESGKMNRLAHIGFIMFTFTSPLLMACLMGLFVTAIRWFGGNQSNARP